jgi:uncharacterized protein YkwD
MTPIFDRAAQRLGTGSRRSVLCGLLGAAAATLAGMAPRGAALATSVSGYCAEGFEQEFLTLINDYRAATCRGRWSLGQSNSAAAQLQSADMANRNYFSHTTLGTGEGPSQRMIAHSYPANTTWWGENIYAGYGVQNGVDLGSAQAAFTAWKNSASHNANMLNAHYVVIGIDRTSNPNSQYRNYWTTDFGGVTDQAATICGSGGGGTPPANVQLAIVGRQQSSNSTGAANATDGNATTAWRTKKSSTRPTSAFIRFDLGQTRTLAEIRWQFSKIGFADQFTIEVSTNGSSWQTLATRGNAPAVGAWQVLPASASARYVRFSFANPNGDTQLGWLSEAQIFGPGTAARTASADSSSEGGTEGDAQQALVPPVTSEDVGVSESAGNVEQGQGQSQDRQRKSKRGHGKKKRQRGRKKRG